MNFSKMLMGTALLTSVPLQAMAATLDEVPLTGRDAQVRGSTFAGARVRLALGGPEKAEKLRAGLTFSAMQSGRSASGQNVAHFADGVELGITGSEPEPHFSVAGYSLAPGRLNAGDDRGEPRRKRGSTLKTVAIVAGGLLLVGGAGLYVFWREAAKNSD